MKRLFFTRDDEPKPLPAYLRIAGVDFLKSTMSFEEILANRSDEIEKQRKLSAQARFQRSVDQPV
jgi:hypothetical protein